MRRAISALAAAVLLVSAAAAHAHKIEGLSKPPATAQKPLPGPAVARTGTMLVTLADFKRWQGFAVASSVGTPTRADRAGIRQGVMKFLIQEVWVRLEAAEHGLAVSARDVDRAVAREKRESFPEPRDYRAYLERSGMTERDVRFQARTNALFAKLLRHISRRAKSVAGEHLLESRFSQDLPRKWRPRTTCRRGYGSPFCP